MYVLKRTVLTILPEELRKYLLALYEANLERNKSFMDALLQLYVKFAENNIPSIFFKGCPQTAATII